MLSLDICWFCYEYFEFSAQYSWNITCTDEMYPVNYFFILAVFIYVALIISLHVLCVGS